MAARAKTVAIFYARSGRAEALRHLLHGMIAPSRAEAGNLRYDLWIDPADGRRFLLDELYVDRAAVEMHRSTPHFRDYAARVGDLADRQAWTLAEETVADAEVDP